MVKFELQDYIDLGGACLGLGGLRNYANSEPITNHNAKSNEAETQVKASIAFSREN